MNIYVINLNHYEKYLYIHFCLLKFIDHRIIMTWKMNAFCRCAIKNLKIEILFIDSSNVIKDILSFKYFKKSLLSVKKFDLYKSKS